MTVEERISELEDEIFKLKKQYENDMSDMDYDKAILNKATSALNEITARLKLVESWLKPAGSARDFRGFVQSVRSVVDIADGMHPKQGFLSEYRKIDEYCQGIGG